MNFFEKFRVVNGKSTHKWVDKLGNYISKLKDGEYTVIVKEYDRTLAQNSTLWMWVSTLKEHHGYTKQEMYDALIDAYSWTYTYRGIDGKPRQKKVTTSMMSVTEMRHFMESVIQHAAEENVELRIPDEY